MAANVSDVTMTCTSATLTTYSCVRNTTDVTRFTLTMSDTSLFNTSHNITISMHLNPSDVRTTTFVASFDGAPYFTTELSIINLRAGRESIITIPAATDDQNATIYYQAVHDIPSGANVYSTVSYGNTFEFKNISASMNETYQFNISACGETS